MAKKFLMQRRVTIDGVLPDGIDDNAIGGLPEVSMMLCRLPDGIDGAYDEMPNCRA